MNKMYRLFLILITIMLFLVSCSGGVSTPNAEEQALFQKYYDKANELLKANNLDGTPEMVFDRSEQGYKFYYLTIHSNKFSELSQDKIAEILWTLYYLDTGGGVDSYWITPKVISNGNEYSYDDGMLHKNGSNWYASSSSSSSSSTKGDFEMSWDSYSSEYNSLGGVITITKKGSSYTEKIVMSDGSSATYNLSVLSEGSVIKLDGHFGDSYEIYPHDYIQIESNGWLGFYDDKGLIYRVPPR